MKLLKSAVLMFSFLFATASIYAQQVELANGDVAILKGEKGINVEFTYDKIAIGDYSNEKDYIKHKVDDMNAKEAGTGDKWALAWNAAKKDRYEPKFIELFTKASEMSIDSTAKYTLIFKTTFIEPGYQVVVKKKAAQLEGTAWLVETKNKAKKLATFSVEKGGGYFRGGSFDSEGRIAEVYAVTGRKIGELIKKNTK